MPMSAVRWRFTRSKRVYLTFDDGPDPRWTPQVLDALDQADATATFFVIGERVAAQPELARQLGERGHEVALHCMRHRGHHEATQAEIEEDTRTAVELLADMGVRPRRWRPPGGRIAEWSPRVAAAHGLRLTGWSADVRDWSGEPVSLMLSRARRELAPGSVLVMHDGLGPGATRTGCAETVALIEPLVRYVRRRGWTTSPLGDDDAWEALPPTGGPPRLTRHNVSKLIRRHCPRWQASPRDRYELGCLSEESLSPSDLDSLKTLLADVITRHRAAYRQRGFRRIRPVFRTVAKADGEIVGQQSVFLLETDPPRTAFGLGDVVVRPQHRRQGLARRLIEEAVERCWESGAELVLTDTETVAVRTVFYSLGFAPVERFTFFYERDGTCHWHPNWMAAVRHPEPDSRLRLDEGDF